MKRRNWFASTKPIARRCISRSMDGRRPRSKATRLLVALLVHQRHVRHSEFGDGVRAGFCLMGACQDCWVWTEEGERLRACTDRDPRRVAHRDPATGGDLAQSSVIVVGAGPAGVRCAETLVAAGLTPIVVDESRRDGGQIYRRQPEGFRRGYAALYGTAAVKAEALHRKFDALRAQIDYRPETLAWNVADGHLHRGAGRAAPRRCATTRW